jgi:hypothetical protein
MDRNDRVARDAAGVGPYARQQDQLVRMSALSSWSVGDGEPDIRGWDVCTVSGKQLGAVTDLLVDQGAGEVVLLDVDLPGTDRHTLVPIRVVEIDRAHRVVRMDSADVPAVLADGSTVAPRGLVVDRPAVVQTVRDDVLPVEDADADRPAANRRRAERRRIDRTSTDL